MNILLKELQTLARQVPPEAIDRCAQKIAAHERVFVYGAGRSGLMLRALAMRLMQLGKTVYVVGETITPAIRAGDLLIAASASGKTPSVCRYAQTALECGAQLLIVTANASSELTAYAPPDMLLPAGDKDYAAVSAQPMGSLFEQALLLWGDAVVCRLAADPAVMRENHANLE